MAFFRVADYQGNGPWQYNNQETLARTPYTRVSQGNPTGRITSKLRNSRSGPQTRIRRGP